MSSNPWNNSLTKTFTPNIAQDHYSDSYGPLRNKQRGCDGEKRKGLRDLTVAFDPTVSYIEPSRK